MTESTWGQGPSDVATLEPLLELDRLDRAPLEPVDRDDVEIQVEPERVPAEEFPALIRTRIRPGDALLSGGRDPISLIIQMGTKSWFSHIGVVTGLDEVTEAYDYALTPDEDDEGVYRTPIDRFLTRCATTRRVRIVRPNRLDVDGLLGAADHLIDHSPAFPSVGMAMLAMCGLSRPALQLLPRPVMRRATMNQIRWTADGTAGVHCAETATRLYVAAGVPITFRRPSLAHHLALLVGDRGGGLLPLPETERRAEPGYWPRGYGPAVHVSGAYHALLSASRALEVRLGSTARFDAADLIMPGDFVRAQPFTTVGDFARRGRHWIEVA